MIALLLALVTYVNPLDVNYPAVGGNRYDEFSSPADPEIIWHGGHYWMFASKCGGYYKSDDLAHWQWIRTTELPTDEWAPTVAEIDGTLHWTARGGTVHRAVDLDAGHWKKLPQKVGYSADSALFNDEGRLYLYYGGSTNRVPIFGCEIDPKTFADKIRPLPLMEADMQRYGWEVRGDNNEDVNGYTYIEGSHMFNRGGRYYLQYAASGTQFASYSDTALVGDTPLGPFKRQRTNPFSYKSTGYIPSAGHGKTFEDRYGNVWHVTTGRVFGFNRRLVMFPVYFDADGEMWCDTAFGDWPFAVPDRKIRAPEELRMGWMELAEGKTVTCSSAIAEHPASAACDDDINTFWSAATGNEGEWLAVDLGKSATVRAVQIGFGGQVEKRGFKIEAETKPGVWRAIAEDRSHRPFAEHCYFQLAKPALARRLRVTNLEAWSGNEKFAIRGFRVFGTMDKPKPAAPEGMKVVRDASDRRHATVTWKPVPDAQGYLIRFGVAPGKMHLVRKVKDCRAEIRFLDAQEDYVWSVTAYNEAGLGSASKRE